MLVEELLLNNLFIVLNQKLKINNYNLFTFIFKLLDLTLDLKQGVLTGLMPSHVHTATSHCHNPYTGDNYPSAHALLSGLIVWFGTNTQLGTYWSYWVANNTDLVLLVSTVHICNKLWGSKQE